MKKFKVLRNNKEEIMEEQPLRELLFTKCGVTPNFLIMMKNLEIKEGLNHFESMTEITRIE